MQAAVAALFAVLALTAAVWVVALRNLFRATLSLGVVLLAVAGLFLLLEAEFLAFVQILVYVGAVLTLVIFAIMLTTRRDEPPAPVSAARRQTSVLGAAGVSIGLFLVLVAATHRLLWPAEPLAEAVTLRELGQHLVTALILPFEAISLVFVAAVIGAIAIAAPHRTPPAE